MNHAIRNLLSSMYGETATRGLEPALRELAHKYATPISKAAGAQPALPLSERDALLIAYADHVREPDVAPLRTLTDFAERHLAGVISGIHILPFYPWSSDDGFSVKDFFAVDSNVGDWEDVKRLGCQF